MKVIIKNTAVVIAGVVIGSMVNMGLIMISGKLIPPPAGADVTTLEGLRASLHLFEPKHFVMPFAAHALGTLTGAFLAALLASSHPVRLAFIVGAVFFAGGAMNVSMLPAPVWFNVTDLVLAYLPMAYMGAWLAGRIKK